MEILKKPFWLLISVVFPLLLLIYFFYVAYGVIESLMEPEIKNQWLYFGIYYGIIAVSTSLYAITLSIKKLKISFWFAIVLVAIGSINVVLYTYITEYLIPRNIPSWLFTSSDLRIYPYSFMIPSLLHGLMLLVIHKTSIETNAWKNLLFVVVIPFSFYILFNIVAFLNLDNAFEDLFFRGARFSKHLGMYFMVLFVCLFLYFIFRFVFALSLKRDKETSTLVRILFCIIFPVAGLLFNDNLFDKFAGEVFGYFHHLSFYILAVLNGLLLVIPNHQNPKIHLLQFIGRAALFSYTVYFFIIFAPWLPISILAILAIGFGFLMLTPVILFVFHIRTLNDDFTLLKKHFNTYKLTSAFIGAFLLIPAIITINFKIDKYELENCLNFLYDHSYIDNDFTTFNEGRITRLLDHIDQVKYSDTKQKPFIDSYYNSIVLDNLLLSDSKLTDIEGIITGEDRNSRDKELTRWRGRWTYPDTKAEVKHIETKTEFLADSGYYKSWIHLDLATQEYNQVQYKAYLKTEPGTFISNYYLDIENKRKYGILAEKRTAKWIYNNITKTRRDPGLLENISPNNYKLFVYPVSSSLPRKTGIEVIHREPTTLILDDVKITLGEKSKKSSDDSKHYNSLGVVSVSNKAKQKLKKTVRPPVYHLLIDWSKNTDTAAVIGNVNDVISKIEHSENAEVVLYAQNYNAILLSKTNWKKQLLSIKNYGGFFPEHEIKKIYFQNFKNSDVKKPIVILVTTSETKIQHLEGLADLHNYTPDVDYIYRYFKPKSTVEQNDTPVVLLPSMLNESGFHRINMNTGDFELSDFPFDNKKSVLLFKEKNKSYLVKNDSSTTLINLINSNLNYEPKNKYEQALKLYLLEQEDLLYPEKDLWLPIVKESFKQNIASKFTSFITVENEAQEKMLAHKQKEVLTSNKNLDLEEDVEEMSEPSLLWYLIAGIILVVLYFRRKYNFNTY